ncbi:MAG: glycosyltransferase family 39 protein [Candidatus Marithrix sp.]|nr:glycosyltransferase family 39 protein [Candidatus Marithrix sp.]
MHTIFILNEDHALMVAYETGDSGHLAHAVMNMFNYPIYNQHNYHYAASGQLFNTIAFIVVLALKFIGQLFGFYNQPIFGVIDDQPIFNSSMIAINFTFSLISILLFFKISKLLFDNKKISFVASLIFMFLPWAAIYMYWLKSDATGMVFILTAILYLIKFVKQEPKAIYFYIAFVSLVLTTLSKMYHGFLLFPIFLVFFLTYCDKKNINYLTYLFSKNFFKILISLPFIYILIIFIITPYAIIDFNGGIYSERWMFMPWDIFVSMFKSLSVIILNILSPDALAVSASALRGQPADTSLNFYNWITMFRREPIIYLNIILLYLLIMPLFFYKKLKVSLLFTTSVIFCSLYLLIVIYGNKSGLHYHLRYIYPIAPLLILNIVAVILYIWNQLALFKQSYYLKIFFASLGGLFFLSIFVENITITTNSLLSKAAYKHSTVYKTREFIMDNSKIFKQGKILLGIGVAPMPPKITWLQPTASVSWVTKRSRTFKKYVNKDADIFTLSWTTGRHGLEFIKDIDIKYLILNESHSRIYKNYIKKNHFKPIKVFKPSEKELTMFTTWFPYANPQLNTLQTTKKLLEIHGDSDIVIGPKIVFYAKM